MNHPDYRLGLVLFEWVEVEEAYWGSIGKIEYFFYEEQLLELGATPVLEKKPFDPEKFKRLAQKAKDTFKEDEIEELDENAVVIGMTMPGIIDQNRRKLNEVIKAVNKLNGE